MGLARIDVAWFTCNNCGHRSTPPDTINYIPHVMETYAMVEPEDLPDSVAEQSHIAKLKQKHKNNEFTIEKCPCNDGKTRKLVKMKRCYSKIAFQSHTTLEESKHIILACPQCNTTMYEVQFP